MLNVGLNGFGRIGRAVFRVNQERQCFRVVAINDLDPNVDNHAYLLKFDSIYGRFPEAVEANPSTRIVSCGQETIKFYAERDLLDVPWDDHHVDVVIDASGVHENVLSAKHLVNRGTVGHVVVTHAPKSGVDLTVIFGINEESFQPKTHRVVATSICDANALGPVVSLLDAAFGLDHGYVTILHPWLSYQNLMDGLSSTVSSAFHPWTDYSLARASVGSMIPKNTTLIDALTQVLPDIAPRLQAISFRVPTAIVSTADATFTLKTRTSVEELNRIFSDQSRERGNLFGFPNDPLVSIDFARTDQSVIVDGRWTRTNPGKGVKLVLWYDNEWGYSNRVVDMVQLIQQK